MANLPAVHVHKGRITDMDYVNLESLGKADLKAQFVELRARGHSYSRIAKRLKVAKGTLANWSREMEADIASLKAMELEALQESFFMLKEGRIRLLGGQLKAIQAELKKRDLSTVETGKLLELMLKTYEALQAEAVEARPMSEDEIEELKALE